ncbi:putative Zn-dependent peptidase [Planifilum fimeticola]|uniref:Putative Zn-dependent peptidase n=1 Tax=Planifilum fimeticola TaxID=201975 RepID=A0A2T0LHM1_9BACL|nr:pitrilysin family protein [Planifilum fimeticola]PRX41869.1 putative Zn-dependent peptidase [Planifilum fimeticola]
MIVRHTLPNGVRIVAEPIPHVRSIALGFWIGTGSRNETDEINGISHFLEHMMFKGTKKRNARQLAEAFDEIGGQVNAFTLKELTCYYAKVLDEHFSIALEILADMFFGSTLPEEEIEKEKKVIIEEIRMVEDTPDDLVHDLLSKAVMGDHPLGFPILGSIKNVQEFDRSRLENYRHRQYRPDQTVIALAGRLPDDFLDQIESYFSAFREGGNTPVCRPPAFRSEAVVRKKPTEQTHLCLGLPGLAIQDPRIYALILLNNVLGGNMSSRLFQKVREERGLAYSVYSYHMAYRDCGLFAIYAGTGPGQENELMRLIFDILEELRQSGVEAAELNKAKEQLKSGYMLSLESTNNRMSRLGKNELLLGKHVTLDETIECIEQVTTDDILHLAQTLFSQPASLAVISPSGEIPPAYRRDALV